jgi:amidohydrolase
VARLIEAHRDELCGTIKFVFQPAEEGLGGAEAMVADGVLENPRPDISLALHLWNDKPFGPGQNTREGEGEARLAFGKGWLGVTPGPAMAASDRFLIRLTGRGGHGASPHLTIDPVLAGGHVVTALQSIVARNLNPFQSAVVTVTSMTGGEAFNVIPETVDLKGTIRTFDEGIRRLILKRLEKVVKGVAGGLGCQAEVEVWKVTPAVVNDGEITRRVQSVAARLLPDVLIDNEERTMGSEDMAYMMDDIPGCYFFVGSANAEKGLNATHHHPRFDFDEGALPRAAGLMSAAAAELLKG